MPDYHDYNLDDPNDDLARARRQRSSKPRRIITPLVLLLEEYNAALGWTQLELATRIGKDAADLNKIFTGASRRPHYSTLVRIARAYQDAGLDVTAESLMEARDRETLNTADSQGIPPQWARLVYRVLAHPPDVQDSFFRLWSQHFHETVTLMSRSRPTDSDLPE